MKVWDAASGECRGTIDTGKIDGQVDAWTLCSDGDQELVSGSNRGAINCWDLSTLQKTASHTIVEDDKFVLSVGRHEDTIAAATYDGQLCIVDRRSGAVTKFEQDGREDPVRSLCFVRDGHGVLFADDGGTVRYYDRRVDAKPSYIFYVNQSWCMTVRASPDGTHFCTAGADRLVKFWDLNMKNEIARIDGHTDQIWEVAYSPDGSQLASCSDDCRVRFHDKERADIELKRDAEEAAAARQAHQAAPAPAEGLIDGGRRPRCRRRRPRPSCARRRSGRRSRSRGSFYLGGYSGRRRTAYGGMRVIQPWACSRTRTRHLRSENARVLRGGWLGGLAPSKAKRGRWGCAVKTAKWTTVELGSFPGARGRYGGPRAA